MLVLGRKVGEAILIGTSSDTIRIIVTAITPHSVRIGISAPPEVVILREELAPRPMNEGEGEI